MLARKDQAEAAPEAPPRRVGARTFLAFAAAALLALNFAVQIGRKPTELLRFAGFGGGKAPRDTWRAFGDQFREHATDIVTPDFLAALTQVESSGNPLASPGWTWRWTTDPFRLYGPASSAVGLLQMTDGNYDRAKTLCVKDGRVARAGPWLDPDACRTTAFYSRLVPSDSIQMTSAFLDVHVRKTAAAASARLPLRRKQELAAVIHLCGPEKGPAFVRAGFDPDALGRCGSQPVGSYVRLVMKHRLDFERLARPAAARRSF
ncbi:MAG: lytic transglycosylase domain-containing protein [Elusimicrobia bacterium]|nr:lytic transglycosylase domain-containing protein [Elusimicrobiota bacterium]